MAVDMVAGAVTKILDAVADGKFVEDETLPAEVALASFLGVSRPTMREAVRQLSFAGVLHVVHGRGTYLMPRFRWLDLRYLMYVAAREGRATEVEVEVLGVEEMLEVGAVRLAVSQRTEADLAEMRRCIDEFEIANRSGDVQALVGLDYAFHDAILATTGNQFVVSAVHPYRDALLGARFRAAESEQVRAVINQQHREILAAIEDRDLQRAVSLMHAHMDQTRRDIRDARGRVGDEVAENL